jgi:hypothetical protein
MQALYTAHHHITLLTEVPPSLLPLSFRLWSCPVSAQRRPCASSPLSGGSGSWWQEGMELWGGCCSASTSWPLSWQLSQPQASRAVVGAVGSRRLSHPGLLLQWLSCQWAQVGCSTQLGDTYALGCVSCTHHLLLLPVVENATCCTTKAVLFCPLFDCSGNDLARCLGWGGNLSQYAGNSLASVLHEVAAAAPVRMDRWSVSVTPLVGGWVNGYKTEV